MDVVLLIDKVFKSPNNENELTEFDHLQFDNNKKLEIIEKESTGKISGKKIYVLKTLVLFHSENTNKRRNREIDKMRLI